MVTCVLFPGARHLRTGDLRVTNTMKLSAQDYLDIHNLYAQYNHVSDAADANRYADCFTEDGTLQAPDIGINVSGRAALIAHKQRDGANRDGQYRRHWNGSVHLEPQSDGSVIGRCYLIAYNGQPGQLPTLADCGVYLDTVIRDDGEWKFSRRILSMDASSWGKK